MLDEVRTPRLVVAGTASNVGKTILTAGLIAAFKARGLTVQSFKVGRDYIDPAYLAHVSGRSAKQRRIVRLTALRRRSKLGPRQVCGATCGPVHARAGHLPAVTRVTARDGEQGVESDVRRAVGVDRARCRLRAPAPDRDH